MATGYGDKKIAQRQGFINMAIIYPLETLGKEQDEMIRGRIARYEAFLKYAQTLPPTKRNRRQRELYETLLGACQHELAQRDQ